jgi:antitoxin HicB
MTETEIGFQYPARLRKDPDGTSIVVTFRDLPEALTEGDDHLDAIVQAKDCLSVAISMYIESGEPLPPPTAERRGEIMIPLGPLMAAKAALYLAMKEAGTSQRALAQDLHCDEREVRRLLDPRHPSKVERINAALAALGHYLTVGMKRAG